MLKKILICNGFSSENYGGTEIYSREINKILSNLGCELSEFCYILESNNHAIQNESKINYLFKDEKDVSFFLNSKFIFRIFHWNKKISDIISHFLINRRWKMSLKKIDKVNNFDVIIFNLCIFCSYKKIAKKSISVQHSDTKYILDQNSLFKRLFNFIFGIQNHYFLSKNIVCFTENDKIHLEKTFKNKLWNIISLFYKPGIVLTNNKELQEEEKFITFFSRYDNTIKNSDIIMDMFEKNNMKLLVISNDTPIEVKNKYKNVFFYDPLNHEDAMNKMCRCSSALILISEYEGLPFVLIDALSFGIPIILRNSFSTASFLVGKNNGILLPKTIDQSAYMEIIKNINFKDFNKSEIKKFAQIFNYENFKRKWINLIKKI